MLARNDLNRQINLASVVRGFDYKQYPRGWWWPQLRSALASLSRLHLVPNYLLKKWAAEVADLGLYYTPPQRWAPHGFR